MVGKAWRQELVILGQVRKQRDRNDADAQLDLSFICSPPKGAIHTGSRVPTSMNTVQKPLSQMYSEGLSLSVLLKR